MHMKKTICAFLALALAAGLLAGCAKKEDTSMKDRKLRELPADVSYAVPHSEHTVSYTDSQGRAITLYGTMAAPQEEGKFPAVILCHGFNGHNTDFPTEFRTWAARGYVCYAFDFCGAQSNGRSTGRTAADYSPYTMKEDLRAAIADIKKLPNVDPTQIFLFGGSQGGFISALTAADEDIRDQIAALALYFPAFNIPDDWRTAPVRDTPLMGYSIGAEFISSIRDLDPFAVIGSYPGDVCIVWGDKDALVARKYIDNAVAAYGADRVDLTVIPGAGHGFGGTALTTAVSKVLSFLESHTYETP